MKLIRFDFIQYFRHCIVFRSQAEPDIVFSVHIHFKHACLLCYRSCDDPSHSSEPIHIDFLLEPVIISNRGVGGRRTLEFLQLTPDQRLRDARVISLINSRMLIVHGTFRCA